MKNKRNTINGQPLEFGNWEQICFLRNIERILSGNLGFEEVEWFFCQYSGDTHDNGTPKFKYVDPEEGTDLGMSFRCPKCDRVNYNFISYDPAEYIHGPWIDTLIAADMSIEKMECDDCHLKFEVIEGSIFVIPDEE